MPERDGHGPPDLPEPEEVIAEVSQELGLNPDAEPEWGYGPPHQKLYPEEAATVIGRRQAQHCLSRLYYYLEWRLQSEQPKVTAQDVIATLDIVREEAQIDYDPEYNPVSVLGAAKRTLAWYHEKKQYEESAAYDRNLRIYCSLHDLLEEVVQPEEVRVIKDIERQIGRYVQENAPQLAGRFHAYLNHIPIRLLREEADHPQARDAASWCHEFLLDRVAGARDAQILITPGDIQAHFEWYRNTELHQEEKWRRGDFTLENVLGATKRRLLFWHQLKDLRHDWQQSYQNTFSVYKLIKQVLNPGGSTNPQGEGTENDENRKEGPSDRDPLGPDDVPF